MAFPHDFFAPVLSPKFDYFTLCTVLTLSLLSRLFPSEASQAGIYGPLSQTEAADAAAGSAAPPPSTSSSSSSPLSSSTPAFCPASISSRQIVERQPRMLNFRVEYRQRSVDLVMEEGSTVGEFVSRYVRTEPTCPSADPLHSYISFAGGIKQILETELGVPVSKMQLKGWKTGDISDSVS